MTHHEHVMSTMPEAVDVARRLLADIQRLGGGPDTVQMQHQLQNVTRLMARVFDGHSRVLYPIDMGDTPWVCACGAKGEALLEGK